MTEKRPQHRQDDSDQKNLSNEPNRELIYGERFVEKYDKREATHNSENDPRGSGTGQTRDPEKA